MGLISPHSSLKDIHLLFGPNQFKTKFGQQDWNAFPVTDFEEVETVGKVVSIFYSETGLV